MLAQALTSIGGEYIDYPLEFHELERKMEAERIAGKKRQQDWERKYGGDVAHS